MRALTLMEISNFYVVKNHVCINKYIAYDTQF